MIAKRIAAEKAVEFIEDGMTVGIGSGSTTFWAIQCIAERVQSGLKIKAVAGSRTSKNLAVELRVPIVPFSEVKEIDITIDGSDEVDPKMNLIKGGGGALLREKILAFNSRRFVVIVDESKLVDQLGRFPLPVEVLPFAVEMTQRNLKKLGCRPILRLHNNGEFITDNGNVIIDCGFNEIADPVQLDEQLKRIPGVIETGLFTQMADLVIVGNRDGSVSMLKKT